MNLSVIRVSTLILIVLAHQSDLRACGWSCEWPAPDVIVIFKSESLRPDPELRAHVASDLNLIWDKWPILSDYCGSTTRPPSKVYVTATTVEIADSILSGSYHGLDPLLNDLGEYEVERWTIYAPEVVVFNFAEIYNSVVLADMFEQYSDVAGAGASVFLCEDGEHKTEFAGSVAWAGEHEYWFRASWYDIDTSGGDGFWKIDVSSGEPVLIYGNLSGLPSDRSSWSALKGRW